MWVVALFFGLTLIEIALFIVVGGWLTLWPTLALVVVLPIIGTWLARLQGLGVMSDLGASLQTMRKPSAALAHGPLIMLAWVLFLIPGFFTDFLGFLLLIPALRGLLITALTRRMTGFSAGQGDSTAFDGRAGGRDDLVIDADYYEIDPNQTRRPGQSGWTQD